MKRQLKVTVADRVEVGTIVPPSILFMLLYHSDLKSDKMSHCNFHFESETF